MDFICSLKGHVKSFIVITHDPDLAIEYTDRAIVLNDGEIITDGPARLNLSEHIKFLDWTPPTNRLVQSGVGEGNSVSFLETAFA